MSKKQITYNEALKEIEEIIASFEDNEIDIDVVTVKVKRACFLIQLCKDKLKNVEEDLEKLFREMD